MENLVILLECLLLTDRVSTKQYIVAVRGNCTGSSLEFREYPGSNDWMKGKPTHSSLDHLQLESHLLCFRPRFAKKPQETWHDMVNYGTDLVVMGARLFLWVWIISLLPIGHPLFNVLLTLHLNWISIWLYGLGRNIVLQPISGHGKSDESL